MLGETYSHEDSHCTSSCHGILEDISIESANNRDRARCVDTTEESEYQERRPIRSQCTCHCEECEDNEASLHDDLPSICFAEGSKEDGGPAHSRLGRQRWEGPVALDSSHGSRIQ